MNVTKCYENVMKMLQKNQVLLRAIDCTQSRERDNDKAPNKSKEAVEQLLSTILI